MKASALKKAILRPAKKLGIEVVQDGQADQALTSTSRAAATLVNEGQKTFDKAAKEVRSTLDDLRAKVHAATAPKQK